jgi:hypothetical protein
VGDLIESNEALFFDSDN